MRLPGPNTNVRWKDYEINTPTFDLTPVEKPDFSPYLIHMTGRRQLAAILRGENAPDGIEVPEGHGYLKAAVPVYGSGVSYNCQVVCFTETPIFALDFFRYRSFKRWRDDQQFGIGFSKSRLVNNHRVRPVVYFDDSTNSKLLSICHKVESGSLILSNDNNENDSLKQMFAVIKPLLFPLLESQSQQGYMWEREWRFVDPNGMVFNLDDIKVICCPNNERQEIEDILGNLIHEQSIQIVETWKEYDEVTNYLNRRSRVTSLEQIDRINDIQKLQDMVVQNEQGLHSLELYSDVFKETADRLNKQDINEILAQMRAQSVHIRDRILKLEIEEKEKKEKSGK